MAEYKADLGTWTKGHTVKFEANDDKAALLSAELLIDDSVDGYDAEVVQISVKTTNGWLCIYDYMNGFYRKL